MRDVRKNLHIYEESIGNYVQDPLERDSHMVALNYIHRSVLYSVVNVVLGGHPQPIVEENLPHKQEWF